MKKLKQAMLGLLFCAMVVAMTGSTKAYALSDGAYTVSVSYSYKNPETGKTEDGSSNIALGESMIGSMLESTALVEQVNGKTYVTIGLGLMSNVSNVKISTQTSTGSYKQASITKTGSGTKSGDTVNHYRFQVSDTSRYIKPAVFVDPMGREVQFFVKLKMGTKKSGSGIYNAELATKEETKATATPKATAKPKETTKPTATAKPTATPEAVKATEAATTDVPATKAPEKAEAVVEQMTEQPSTTEVQPTEEMTTEVPEEIKEDYTKPICIAVIVVSVLGTAGIVYSNHRWERRKNQEGKNDE